MKEVARYTGCFVCGDRNDFGLRAKFYFDGAKAIAEYTAGRNFEGYSGVLHGGIIAALLDEVMIKALLAGEIFAMTVELNVRFHQAVLIGQKLKLEGIIVEQNGRLYQTTGSIKLENGEIVASSTGKYLKVRDKMKIKLLESLER